MNPDFRDILSEFSAAGVEYLLIGAYALAAHGIPRATGDIDLWVRCSKDNAARVLIALTRFGARLTDVSAADFTTPGMVVQIGVAPRRIDVLTAIDGVDFETAWPDRQIIDVGGISVPVIGRRHLLINKRATGRPKDASDALQLEEQDEKGQFAK